MRAWEDLLNYIDEGLAQEDPPQPWTWKHRAKVSKNNQSLINQTMGKKGGRLDKPDWAWNSEPQPERPWAQKRMLSSKWKNKQLKEHEGAASRPSRKKMYFTVVPVSAKPLLEKNTYMKTEDRRAMSWVALQESSGNLNQSDMNQRQINLST
jgi:hypothetical protein